MLTNAVFIKIHKCSSQSVYGLLKGFSNMNNLDFIGAADYGVIRLQKMYKQGIPPDRPCNIFAEHKEYNHKFFKWLIKDPIYFTFIREPLQRAISHYYYYDFPRQRGKRESFIEHYHKNPSLRKNFISKFMGYMNIDDITLENIRERYAFVGLTEKFKESIEKLEQTLNWELPRPLTRRNTNNKTKPKNLQIPEETKRLFIENNSLDYKLYQLVSENFDK